MTSKKPSHHPTSDERDERVKIPLDPEEALRGLLAVEPGADEPDSTEEDDQNNAG